jgi:hypothetical protein
MHRIPGSAPYTLTLALVSFAFALAAFPTAAAERFVSPKGDDANVGSIEAPFRTIVKGVSTLQPGDTLYLRGGRYHEEVHLKGLHGAPDRPIVIRSYPKENVLLDGTVELTGLKWTKHPTQPNVWQTKIDRDIWQLFVDDRMMINARWPNANHPFENEERSNWWDRRATWCHVQHKIDGKVVSGFDFERAKGILVEDGVKGLADLGRSVVGCIGVLNVVSMTTFVGRVCLHEAGSPYFEYDVKEELQQQVRNPRKSKLRRIITKNVSHAYFYFEGWADLIDTPDEWAYDKDTKTLYLYAQSAAELEGRRLRGKVQTTAISLDNCSCVTIQGLNFFATCLQAFDCSHLTVEDNLFNYPSYSKRMLGSLEDIEVITITAGRKRAQSKEGTQNVFRNNRVRRTDGMGLNLNGKYDVVDNNEFQYIDISGTPGGSTGVRATGSHNTFRRNTIEICGSSKATKVGGKGLILLNRVSRFGYLQDDGTAFQAAGGGQQGVLLTQNWLHDAPKYGLRFDGSEFADAYERGTYNGAMVRNVAFNTGGMMLKGDDHRLYSNLCYNISGDAFKVLTSSQSQHSNHDTIVRNNIGNYINASRRDDPLENPPVGPTDHNWVNLYPKRDVRELLRDPDNLDFRPRADAAEIIDVGVDIPAEKLRCGTTLPDLTTEFKIGRAPDIGAYEFGAKNYWIPGYEGPRASTPIPPDGCVTAKPDADLMWLPAYRSELSRVYFGVDPGELNLVAEQDNNIYEPGSLDPTLTYFWRVDCKTPDGWVEGEVWRFQARGRPFPRGSALPSSYVAAFREVYDFDQENLGKDAEGLIMPWKAAKFANDSLNLRGGTMEILPDGARQGFAPIAIPNITVDFAKYPFLSFRYKTVARQKPAGFFAGFTVPGGVRRDVFPETAVAVLAPSPGAFTPVFLDLSPAVEKGMRQFGSGIAQNFLLQIGGPEDAPWQKGDGPVILSDFRIGFACLLDRVRGISIVGQRRRIESSGRPVVLSIEDLDIRVRVAVEGEERPYEFPARDPLPTGWRLTFGPGAHYTVVDGDIVKPDSGFAGTLRVPARIEAGGFSAAHDLEIIWR